MKLLLAKWGLPFVIILVAGFQFYNVYYNNLTRWKGGGFGMYSEMHPKHRQVWITLGDSTFEVKQTYRNATALQKEAHKLRFRPSANNMKQFATHAATAFNTNALTASIWEVRVQKETNRLYRKKIAEYEYAP